jgi:hypothetical protein
VTPSTLARGHRGGSNPGRQTKISLSYLPRHPPTPSLKISIIIYVHSVTGGALPDSEPSPRAGILSAKGCFLKTEPSPKGSYRRRPLSRPQPAKAPSPRAVGHPLGGRAPRDHHCSKQRYFLKKRRRGHRDPHRLAAVAGHRLAAAITRHLRGAHTHAHTPPEPATA